VRWTPGDRGNIEDERGRTGMSGLGAGGLGLGGVIVLLLLSWATGTNYLSLFTNGSSPDATGTSGQVASSPQEERQVDFVDAVMKDVQTTWATLLPNQYRPTRVVLFRDVINSGCGAAESATGPFYCPEDQQVYLDLGFFQEMSDRFGAPGDFARAYVIAHEVGHHIQRLTGIESGARSLRQAQPRAANAVSVAIELQADCFAGVWGHAASQPGRAARGEVELEKGDVEEGLNAAAAIGDDRLQRMTTGRIQPESFTHGSSAQRVAWFRKGLTSGDPAACDTFGRNSTSH
jgi:uncharacterized protein